jgi:hypothetical protein
MENDKNITIKGLIDAYGKDKAAMIITKTVQQTIITTQQKMRNAKPMYAVLLKDPIAGKLIIKTDHVLNLQFIGKDGKRRNLFTESEIKAMRRNMPGFDKYYEVRRGGFENE